MPIYYASKCGVLNRCVGGPPTSACEDGENWCSSWQVGDEGLMAAFESLTPDEFQAHMEASTTKFYGRYHAKGLTIEEPGMLAASGLQKGDILTGVVELRDQASRRISYTLTDAVEQSGTAVGTYTMKHRRDDILTWQMKAKTVAVVYERDGKALSGIMDNLAAK